MKRPISIEAIDKMAPLRPEGYKEAILAAGEVKDGFVWVEWDTYMHLLQQYSPNARVPKQMGIDPKHLRGLGDAVAVVAQPIARGIDKVFGTNVQGCGGCKKRQEYLNKAVPFTH